MHLRFPLKTSRGFLFSFNDTNQFLQQLSVQDLVSELDYARSSKNYDLETLVMNEYYRKLNNK
jgi:hypothetical protein